MDYIKIAKVKDFDAIRLKSYQIMGKRVAIFKQDDGSFIAVEGACKHQGADLAAGELKGSVVTCPRHKWQYDLLNGQCINHESLPLRPYGLKVENEMIHITLTPLDEE